MVIPIGGIGHTLGIGIDLITDGTPTGMTHGILHFIMVTDMVTRDSMEVLVFTVLFSVLIGIIAHTGMAIIEIGFFTMATTETEI
jgi:hypothetical protein